jgi:hypothetical protein
LLRIAGGLPSQAISKIFDGNCFLNRKSGFFWQEKNHRLQAKIPAIPTRLFPSESSPAVFPGLCAGFPPIAFSSAKNALMFAIGGSRQKRGEKK